MTVCERPLGADLQPYHGDAGPVRAGEEGHCLLGRSQRATPTVAEDIDWTPIYADESVTAGAVVARHRLDAVLQGHATIRLRLVKARPEPVFEESALLLCPVWWTLSLRRCALVQCGFAGAPEDALPACHSRDRQAASSAGLGTGARRPAPSAGSQALILGVDSADRRFRMSTVFDVAGADGARKKFSKIRPKKFSHRIKLFGEKSKENLMEEVYS